MFNEILNSNSFMLNHVFKSTCLAAGLLATASLSAAELSVRIEGIAEKGDIHVYVFTAAEGFPKEESAVLHQVYPKPEQPKNGLSFRLPVPDVAELVIMAYQDKDGDGKMSRLLGMIPQEPYGLSRNPKLFGKPKFSDAAIKISDSAPVVIRLND